MKVNLKPIFADYCRQRNLPTAELLDLIENPWFVQLRALAQKRIDEFRVSASCVRPMPHVHIDFVHNGQVDAFAAFHQGTDGEGAYLIGLHGGLPLTFSGAFRRLLAEPGVFSDIGDASGEEAGLPPLVAGPSGKISHVQLEKSFPKDPVRAQASLAMSELAVELVIAHEFRHIVAGHLLLLGERGHPLTIIDDQTSRDLSLFRQALEMDADKFAIVNVARNWLQYSGRVKGFDTPEARLRALVRTLFLICKVWGSGEAIVCPEVGTHPPPSYRQVLMCTALDSLLAMSYPADRSTLVNIVRECVPEIELGYAGICANNVVTDGLRQAASAEGRAHTSRILREWDDIRPTLSRLAYIAMDEPFEVTYPDHLFAAGEKS